MSVRRAWSRAAAAAARPRALWALAALAALCAAGVRAPVHLTRRADFPRAHPAALAHLLADFSTHPHSSHAWRVEDERGNYTEWRYSVSWECGARCAGAASVRAAAALSGQAHAPAHGRAASHSVRAEVAVCSPPPLLPWPRSCEWVEVEWWVRAAADGGGSAVEERARAWCSALRVLSGACARELRAHADAHLAAVRAHLDSSPA